MPGPLLDVIDLRKNYGPLVALAGVSFQVFEGEIFGLLGPNGAGKTTLLSILSCLAEPTSGEVRLQGTPLRSSSLGVRRQIGIVPQDLAVYDALTARENLTFFGELFGLNGDDDEATKTPEQLELEKRNEAEQRAAELEAEAERLRRGETL